MTQNKIRVLMAKVGMDGHDKGAIAVTGALRDAGMEVIYTGLRRKVQQVVTTAIQEDVDVVGLSILSGTHLNVASKIIDKMKELGVENKPVVIGGVIPDEDVPKLKEIGVAGIFTQSSSYDEMIEFIKNITNNSNG